MRMRRPVSVYSVAGMGTVMVSVLPSCRYAKVAAVETLGKVCLSNFDTHADSRV